MLNGHYHKILYSMSWFLKIKTIIPKLNQKQIAKDLTFCGSLLKRYRTDIKVDRP